MAGHLGWIHKQWTSRDREGKKMKISSQFCQCGAHVALVATQRPNVWRAVEYPADRYTPSERIHICPAAK